MLAPPPRDLQIGPRDDLFWCVSSRRNAPQGILAHFVSTKCPIHDYLQIGPRGVLFWCVSSKQNAPQGILARFVSTKCPIHDLLTRVCIQGHPIHPSVYFIPIFPTLNGRLASGDARPGTRRGVKFSYNSYSKTVVFKAILPLPGSPPIRLPFSTFQIN